LDPSGPVLVAEGYFDETLYALDPTTGATEWTFLGNVHGAPAVSSGGTIYISDSATGLYAIDSSGNVVWHDTSLGLVEGAATIASDGTVYVSTQNRHLYALNPANGDVKWSYRLNGPGGTPVIGQNGYIYIAGADGNFYAIH
jgi:outer membrane protein assembly factor BamB